MERRQTLVKDLVAHLPEAVVFGSLERSVIGITSDSRQVNPDFLFLVKRGGERFLPEVVQKGATAILTDRFQEEYPELTQIVCSDLSLAEEMMGKSFYPSHSPLFLVGITGTNGKTTTSYLVRHLLGEPRAPCGLIGTVGWDIGNQLLPSTHTTPDLLENYRLFSLMRQNGCSSSVMEVSSHALCQGRVRGIPFDVAVFTNLTQDHLDYHKTMQSYAMAKSELFTSLQPGKIAIINADSPYASQMVARSQAKTMTYGFSEDCHVRASLVSSSPEGLSFTLHHLDKKRVCKTNLVGHYNLYNILAAVSVALARGLSLEAIACKLEHSVSVPGRLEPIVNDKGVFVFVDYAHTEDALLNVLGTLRQIAQKRIVTVFGCGGDRDQDKRPKMGRAAEKFSDLTIVTSDNPRSENPDSIIQEIVKGMQSSPLVISDRKEAIAKAIAMATPGDIVLIAGKGHEQGQILATHTLPFDDREVAAHCFS